MDSLRFRNFNYLVDVLRFRASANPADFEHCLCVMDEYDKKGNNWWIKNYGDDVKLAYYQLCEPCLLIPKETLQSGVSKVVGHSVEFEDLSFKNTALKTEFYHKFPNFIAHR